MSEEMVTDYNDEASYYKHRFPAYSLRISPDLKKDLNRIKSVQGGSLNELITQILEEYVKKGPYQFLNSNSV